MSSRFGLRALQRAQPFARQQVNSQFRFVQRRCQSTTPTVEDVKPTGFAAFWNSPIGPKTVHFWAPIMKWGVVLAGAADFFRPASSLSISQNAALMATGAIWTRWCLIIKPRNVFLASVNFALFCVGATQVGRAFMYQQSVKGVSLTEEVKQAGKDAEASLEKVIEDPKAALKSVVNPK
ncbi:hypothetical protein AMS68_006220 [Peltaster fructicola]|uniref:Mitochondrial pyruvate carrier n=1 Tax=Peltaster fructicola TaxID=286661 RepID=A0A6H0Y113_9PEZI|nr:hypothetical protein AMS68_006220 [Peltaster fructicola]